ncbi:MAG: RluA family pseudouridine synthase [Clostridiaceae bacterium]|nr:RluA family pseudouridine synthase [Clostridiaceae bacterium]
MSRLKYEITAKEATLKLRDYLKKDLKLSTRFMRSAAVDGRILVNGKIITLAYILKQGDKLELQLDKEESQNVEPQKMDLDILFEDEDIVIVNKPIKMVVHPTKSYQLDTLSNGLLYHFRENGEQCIVRLVSRLDMNTSGLVIVAKNQYAHMALARDLHELTNYEKSYIAVVHGHLHEEKGTIDLPILRAEEDSIKRIVDERGQRSVTHFNVLENYEGAQLVKLTLETGRTHQIRVHLSHLGNPIFGDTLYGLEGDEGYIERQALHAYRLVFPHPRTGKLIEIESSLPKDIVDLISHLQKNRL